ncbi:MAG: hypothetical protein ACKVOH_01725 [Chlamydiales bacterium]
MERQHYEQKIAHLEFINDQISTELEYIDRLLKIIGFPDGLETIKNAASEVIEEEGYSE